MPRWGSTKSSKLFAHQSHSSFETDPLNPYRQTDSVNGSTISIRRDYCLTFQCYTRLNAHTTVSFQEHSRYLNNQLMLIDECFKNINLHGYTVSPTIPTIDMLYYLS